MTVEMQRSSENGAPGSDRKAGKQRTPNAPELRSITPVLGLREYWYPAIQDKKVGSKKPVRATILGDDIALFRGKDGQVAAISNICPHRGGLFSGGTCHFAGTITCPYHAWTFDDSGECVAVLSEGPDSFVPGTVQVRTYPTRTLKNVVFIWMGDGKPAPMEEDVPPEFFMPGSLVMSNTELWPVNWRPGLENSLDSHVPYVHRNSVRELMKPIKHYGPRGRKPSKLTAGVTVSLTDTKERPYQEEYPGLGKWPMHSYRLYWSWIFAPFLRRQRAGEKIDKDPKWGAVTAHHLPSMFRLVTSTHAFTRAAVPVDAGHSRMFYYYFKIPKNRIDELLIRIHYYLWYKWSMETNFSMQDMKVRINQEYSTPEKLVASDAEVIVWRRMLAYENRDAERRASLAAHSGSAENGSAENGAVENGAVDAVVPEEV